MKQVLLILLISLITCGEIEESFDDHIILEKSKEKTIASLLKPQTRHATGVKSKYSTIYKSRVTTRYSTRYTSGVTTKYSTRVKTPKIPRKIEHHLKDFPIKGTNSLFKGKSKENFKFSAPRGNLGIRKQKHDPYKDLSKEEYRKYMKFISRSK